MKEIVGTTTEQNLKDAFISESTSILKYLIQISFIPSSTIFIHS